MGMEESSCGQEKKWRTQRVRKIEVENESATRNQHKQQTHQHSIPKSDIANESVVGRCKILYYQSIHIAEMVAVFCVSSRRKSASNEDNGANWWNCCRFLVNGTTIGIVIIQFA